MTGAAENSFDCASLRLAAQAQHAANVADILESVKVHVASRKSATLDLQMGETMKRHGVFVLTTEAKVVRCVQDQSFTMGDHEARNSDQTENRESEIPTCWMKLVLDQHSAGVGKRADHDKHATTNDARKKRQETSRLVQRSKTQRVAMSWTASYMEAKILVF